MADSIRPSRLTIGMQIFGGSLRRRCAYINPFDAAEVEMTETYCAPAGACHQPSSYSCALLQLPPYQVQPCNLNEFGVGSNREPGRVDVRRPDRAADRDVRVRRQCHLLPRALRRRGGRRALTGRERPLPFPAVLLPEGKLAHCSFPRKNESIPKMYMPSSSSAIVAKD